MKYIDFESSYAFVRLEAECAWRISVQSLLINLTDNKKYYLTKEWRAEDIGQYPFTIKAKHETCVIFEDSKLKYLIRDNPVLKKNDFDNQHYQIIPIKENADKAIITETDYDLLDYDSTLNFLKNIS